MPETTREELRDGIWLRAQECLRKHARRPNDDIRAYTYRDTLEMMTAFALDEHAAFLRSSVERQTQETPSCELVQAYVRHYGGVFVTRDILEAVRWAFEDGPANRVRIELAAKPNPPVSVAHQQETEK